MSLRPLFQGTCFRGSVMPPSRAAGASIFSLALGVLTCVSIAALSANAVAASLSLSEALRLAVAKSPQLASQRALAEGASVSIVAAGALPDPELKIKLENMATTTFERFTFRDYTTGMRYGLSQEFPWADKLTSRTQRAEQDARRESVMIDVQRASVQREVAMAWMARYFAAAAEAKVTAEIAEAELAVEAGNAQYRARTLTQGELIGLQRAVIELKNRRAQIALQVKRAQIAMARFIGADADRPLGDAPDVTRVPRAVAGLIDVNELPEVRSALSREAVAAAEAKLARAEYGPDLMAELSFLNRGEAGDIVAFQPGHALQPQQVYSDLVSLQLETSLPVFGATRQGPRYAAKVKELEAARSSSEEARRKQMADVQEMIAEWEGARARALRIESELIPLAVQKREAALAAYRGGTGTLDAVLETRRGELRARLALVQQEQAAGNAWAWLEYVFPVAEN